VVSLSGLKEIPDFTLDEKIRPLSQEERATVPDNFDILGVSLGMTRAEIEENLIEVRGYVINSDYDGYSIEELNWIAEMIVYQRNAANGPRERIFVAYSARHHDASSSQDIAAMVRRSSVLRRGSNLTIDVLRDALTRKYGAPTKGDDRRYGRDGQLIRDHDDLSQFCEPGKRQKVRDFVIDARHSFRSHCGSKLDVQIEFDEATGFVTEYALTLASVDYLNNGHWSKLAIDLAVEAEAFLGAMEGAATSGPEL
jgi:hypothetical protein